jgi:drug/metabolite transporter (DMT)-like permease
MTKSIKPGIGLIGFIITLLGAMLFSTKAVIVKYAFAHIQTDAVSLLALRMLFALPFYLFAIVWQSSTKEKVTPLTRRQWWQVIVLGLLGYYVSSLLDFVGLQYISAGLERLILFLYPGFVLLMNAFFFKQRITRLQVWALALTYTGIALACSGEVNTEHTGPYFWLGCGLIFLCAITYAGYICFSGRLIPKLGATRFTAWAMLASCGGVLLHYALRGDYHFLQQGGNHLWIYGLLLAVIATVLPSFLISLGMKKIGSNNVAIISGIGPVSTIAQAHYFLGENIDIFQAVGTLLVIAGVLLTGWKVSKA